jgi:hypothetical protein
METRTIPPRSDVAFATTAPRVTPTPPRASRFGEVLSSTVVRSAESVARALPGSPLMAIAVRSATGTGSVGLPLETGRVTPVGPSVSPVPCATPRLTGAAPGTAVPGAAASTFGETPTLEASLQHSQDMNLYYLQVQESVNAQNRSFTTISNVLKAQHDTVKTAIGNIR